MTLNIRQWASLVDHTEPSVVACESLPVLPSAHQQNEVCILPVDIKSHNQTYAYPEGEKNTHQLAGSISTPMSMKLLVMLNHPCLQVVSPK